MKTIIATLALLFVVTNCTSKSDTAPAFAKDGYPTRNVSSGMKTLMINEEGQQVEIQLEAADFPDADNNALHLVAAGEDSMNDGGNFMEKIDASIIQQAEGSATDSDAAMDSEAVGVIKVGGCVDTLKAVVNKSKQRISIFINCSSQPAHVWAVSTGIKGRSTPNFNTRPSGRFGSRTNSSSKYPGGCTIAGKRWGNMPYAVYFAANGNYAIHGTCAEGKLGQTASHGCIRVSRANAIIFQGLVTSHKIGNTRIIVN